MDQKVQIVLTAYNRFKHTKKVLDGLKREKVESIIMYIDAPINQSDFEEQKKIKNIIRNYDFEVNLIERQHNLGLARAITSAVTETLDDNDAIILLEDDCVPRRGFVEFMYKMVNEFRYDKSIGSICGYQFPYVTRPTADNVFLINRFNPWGWATWKDRWDGFSLDLNSYVRKSKIKGLNIEDLGEDVANYCKNKLFLENKMDIWSLNWMLHQFVHDMKVIYPSFSLIENIGFDGTGVHSTTTDVFNVNGTSAGFESWTKENKHNNKIKVDLENQHKIIRFLEENSKMAYVLNNE